VLNSGLKVHHKKRIPNRSVLTEIINQIHENTKKENPNTLITPIGSKCNLNLEKVELERLFEHFDLTWVGRPRVSSCILASMGTLSGVVLDFGHHSTEVETVMDGYSNINESRSNYRAGDYITRELADIIECRLGVFYGYDDAVAMAMIGDIKNNHARFRRPDAENQCSRGILVDLPDGNKICLKDDQELMDCCESTMLRFSNRGGPSEMTLPEEVYSHIMKLPIDERLEHLTDKIYLSGGGALMDGIADRLSSELQSLHRANTSKSAHVKINLANDAIKGPVAGATLLTLTCPPPSGIMAMDGISEFWINKTAYEELGPERAHLTSLNLNMK